MRNSELMHTSYCYSEARSKSIVWAAYAEYFVGEEIMEEGFNPNSGYVYIALEMGVTIASGFNRLAEFIVYDDYIDQEIFFDSYDELQEYLNRLNQG
jgi:hypothetical protein